MSVCDKIQATANPLASTDTLKGELKSTMYNGLSTGSHKSFNFSKACWCSAVHGSLFDTCLHVRSVKHLETAAYWECMLKNELENRLFHKSL